MKNFSTLLIIIRLLNEKVIVNQRELKITIKKLLSKFFCGNTITVTIERVNARNIEAIIQIELGFRMKFLVSIAI